ncbi:MAG: hypothetical protein F6J90_42130 [Moorea sp. SIOASIH]|uniref:hypothetical protein n=1 Tax=Moorena sp. SIOASIH TaxID=2607817 RepID=UPI0013B5CC79|nr:hypothetical protein [Moorena sp. SIOASIH]NEO42568.1 hypothetical protein [Moorena sp. SIOASIH]
MGEVFIEGNYPEMILAVNCENAIVFDNPFISLLSLIPLIPVAPTAWHGDNAIVFQHPLLSITPFSPLHRSVFPLNCDNAIVFDNPFIPQTPLTLLTPLLEMATMQ